VKILNKMWNTGSFTHIYYPNNETLFENASVDVIIFRYCKINKEDNKKENNEENKEENKKENKEENKEENKKENNEDREIQYNDVVKYINNNNGLITFTNEKKNKKNGKNNTNNIEKYFSICVGMVTGKEKFYKNDEFGNIAVLNDKDKMEKYIYINNFPTENDELNQYFLDNKNILISRKIKKFNENNWYEWGAPRNIKTIEREKGKECIYVRNLTRQKIIAFKGKVDYFGGKLLMMIPKKEYEVNLDVIIEYLNNDSFKNNFIYSNRFKMTHRNLSMSNLDIPEIF